MSTKIYDCVMFNGEWDMLEIHLNEHDEHVDYFVIVESDHTFTDLPKPILFDINHAVVHKFRRKIRYVLVTDMPNQGNPWANEVWQRDAMQRALWDAQASDIVLIMDCDEILKPHTLVTLKQDDHNHWWGFHQPLYYCYMNNLCVGQYANMVWGVAVRFHLLAHNVTSFWRSNAGQIADIPYTVIYDAGWHYSYMMNVEQIKNKLVSFSHTEFNTPHVIDQIDPVNQVASNKDILGRDHVDWQLITLDQVQLPTYVQNNLDHFSKYLYPV